MSRTARLAVAVGIGIALTAGLAFAAALAHDAGASSASAVLFWQNSLLQALVPMPNIGTPDRPLYEGTPLNYLAFLASFPVGVIIYTVVAFAVLSRVSQHDN